MTIGIKKKNPFGMQILNSQSLKPSSRLISTLRIGLDADCLDQSS